MYRVAAEQQRLCRDQRAPNHPLSCLWTPSSLSGSTSPTSQLQARLHMGPNCGPLSAGLEPGTRARFPACPVQTFIQSGVFELKASFSIHPMSHVVPRFPANPQELGLPGVLPGPVAFLHDPGKDLRSPQWKTWSWKGLDVRGAVLPACGTLHTCSAGPAPSPSPERMDGASSLSLCLLQPRRNWREGQRDP